MDQVALILRSVGHSVKCQYKVAPSEGKKRGDLEIVGYLRDATGPRNLVIDLNITHDRHGRSTSNPHTNGHLTHPDSLDRPLEIDAHAKITKHQAAYSHNNSTSFMPRVDSTSGRLHCELLRLLFLHTDSSGTRGRESGGEKEKECTAEWKTLVTLAWCLIRSHGGGVLHKLGWIPSFRSG